MNDLERDIAGALAAHRRLDADLAELTDADVRAPSLLPGWTRGHVLAHLARNADSHERMLLAAALGEVAAQYPGGRDQRAGEIEAGAGRPAAELVAQACTTDATVEVAWAAMPEDGWLGTGDTFARACPRQRPAVPSLARDHPAPRRPRPDVHLGGLAGRLCAPRPRPDDDAVEQPPADGPHRPPAGRIGRAAEPPVGVADGAGRDRRP